MNSNPVPFVACGMYAFTRAQQAAWRQLFERFFELSGRAGGQVELRFEHDAPVFERPGLWFGHTCGYPLISYQYETLSPFCLPLFDVPGTAGKLYSSRLVVNTDSAIEMLEQCRGRVAAINNADSNSGMNALRHAVAEIHTGGRFFARVATTGGHLNSVEAVARGFADIAAIDCVTYQLISDWKPQMTAHLRIIGDTVQTTGLPFVMRHRDLAAVDADKMIAQLNQALAESPDTVRTTLHLSGFTAVKLADYQNVIDVEQFALDRGYPALV